MTRKPGMPARGASHTSDGEMQGHALQPQQQPQQTQQPGAGGGGGGGGDGGKGRGKGKKGKGKHQKGEGDGGGAESDAGSVHSDAYGRGQNRLCIANFWGKCASPPGECWHGAHELPNPIPNRVKRLDVYVKFLKELGEPPHLAVSGGAAASAPPA